MAEQYDNTNRFALFKNNKTKDSQPDYTGTITLEGNTIVYSSDGVTLTLTITEADGTITSITIPIGTFLF